jgi:hypothetical protein
VFDGVEFLLFHGVVLPNNVVDTLYYGEEEPIKTVEIN